MMMILLSSTSRNTSDETSASTASERKIKAAVCNHLYNEGANNLL